MHLVGDYEDVTMPRVRSTDVVVFRIQTESCLNRGTDWVVHVASDPVSLSAFCCCAVAVQQFYGPNEYIVYYIICVFYD